MTFTSNFRQFQERQPEMEREAERRLRDLVVLVPCPFQGHVTPILQLGHVLHSKGFSITVAHARCNAPDPSNHPEFSFQGLGHSLSINLDGIIKASDIGLKGRLETIYDMNENCRVPLQEYLEEKGDVVSCIIYDNLMFFFDQVAALLNLPSIVLRPSSAAYFPVLLHVLEHEDTLSSIPESRLEDPILKFHPIRYQDMSIVFRQSEEVRRFMLTSNNIRSSMAIIWNTMEDLEHTWLSSLQQCYFSYFSYNTNVTMSNEMKVIIILPK
ncbi:unnamed protein product [Cuscuta europaea]|uniref:Uncharacterized protein n=1 Tax=Cuscuta europaea TaxID=41803 RepID=A0A9P1ENK3_CUSEU|nr:unnamed protein product [Cuscuta europaea]